MGLIKSLEEIELLRENAILVSKTLAVVGDEIREGVTTLYLDKIAEDFICSQGAIPGFKGLYNFPYTLCVSVGDVVIHGLPSKYELKCGDVVSIDCGTKYKGFCGDSAYTFIVGEVDKSSVDLLNTTREILDKAAQVAVEGNKIGDIGEVIQSAVEKKGYGVVRDMVGHGIGVKIHEKPEVPNYGKKGRGKELMSGMVLCIEPMITLGSYYIYTDKDKWSIRTVDKKVAVHFEYMVVVGKEKADILTTFDYIENKIK